MVYVQKQIISYTIEDITADQINADQFVGTHVGDVLAVDGTKLVDGTSKQLYAPAGFVGDLTGNADTVTNGVYTEGDQTINGVKTHSERIVAIGGINSSEIRALDGNNAVVISESVGASAPKVTILGDLVVQGDSTILNTNIIAVEDINITMAKNNVTSSPIVGSGLTISGGSGDDIVFQYSAENVMSLNLGFDIENGDLRVKDGNASISGSVSAVSANISGSIVSSDITADVKAPDGLTLLDGASKTLVATRVIAPDIEGNLSGQVSDISNHTTDELLEGVNNVYYTDTRVYNALSGGVGVTYSGSGEFSIGQPVGTTDSVEFADLSATGNIVAGGDVTVNGGRVYVKNVGCGVELYSEQANNGMLRFHTSNGQSAFISTTNGNAPIQMTASLVWVRGINGGSGNALIDGDLQVDGDITGPTITALQNSTSTSVANERADRIAADTVLQANIDDLSADLAVETANRISADNTLQSNIDSEESARQSADNTLQANIDAEEASRIAGDAQTLVAATAYTDQEIAALVNSAPATLDTLKEISTALGDDPNLATTLTGQIGTVQANLDTEIATTDAEVTALQAQDTVLQNNIDSEKTSRQAADATLQASINTVASDLATETTNRESADTTLQANIDAESTARQSADTTLQANIDAVAANLATEIASTNTDVSNLETADATLQTNIDNEATTRASADTTLQANINTEATTRAADDAVIQANLNAETTARQSADTTLQSNIDTVASDLASEIATTDSEVTALQAELDATQAGAGLGSLGYYTPNSLANYIQSASSLADADNKLDAALKAEETARTNTDTSLQSQITTLESDLATEESTRESADTALQAAIDAEAATRAADDASTLSTAQAYTDTAITNLVNAAPSTLDTLNELASALGDDPNFATTVANQIATVQTNLDAEIATTDAEITALQAKDITLQANIDSNTADIAIETSARQAADTTLQSNIDTVAADLATEIATTDSEISALQSADTAEAATRASADATLQGNINTVAANLATEIAATDAEVSALQSADTAEATARAAADTTLQSNIDSEEAARILADNTLQSNIDTEEAARIAGDAATLSSAQSYTDTAVSNLIDSAPGALDTLNELAAALGDDANFATTITNQIAAVQADVDQNEADADAAIAALQADVDQNEADADAAIALKADIASPTFTGVVSAPTVDISGELTTGDITIDAGGDDAKVKFVLETNGGADTGGLVWARATGGSDVGAIKYVRSQDSIHFYTNGATTADVTINAAGKLIANNGIEGSLTGTVSDISNHNTDVLTEGSSNLYYTDSRVGAYLSANGYATESYVQAQDAITLAAAKAYSDSLDHDTAQLEADVTQLQSDLSAETSARTAADTVLQTFINNVAADLSVEIATTDSEITALQTDKLNTSDFATTFDSNLSAKSTSDLAEGSNLYYTDARVGSYVAGQGYALKTYVNAGISDLIGNAPTGLKTLEGIAAAINNDPNYSTTISTALGTKFNTADFSSSFNSAFAAKNIENLANVSVNALGNDNFLRYDKSTGVWSNVEFSGSPNIDLSYDQATNKFTFQPGGSHYSKVYDNADNGTSTNDIPVDRAEVILDISGTATNDVYLNLPAGSEGQLLYLVIDPSFTSLYNIYIERTNGSTHPTNIYGTITLSSYSRTAVLRYCDSLGLWTLAGGDAYSSY